MAKPGKFSKLFEPGTIGNMKIRNRIVMPPMATNYAGDDGRVSELMISHYEQRAGGGVGLIITEGICPDFPRGKGWKNEAGIDDDKYMPGFKHLASAVHVQGAKIAMQIHHAGRQANSSFTGVQPVAPSAIPASPGGEVPRELTLDEINDLVNRFALAAGRARDCGFDGVEIHGAHGYLVNQFISRVSNKRTDSYGGDLAGRARFLMEIISAVRGKVGSGYPVWCRINTEELGPESITMDELQSVARMAVKAGCDAIHVSLYGANTFVDDAGALAPFAEAVKKEVSVPVIAVGFLTPEVANTVIANRRADFVAMGRQLLCDAQLPNKLQQGNLDDITPCIRCLKCTFTLFKGKSVQCSVNPTVGREYRYPLSRASSAKKVLVAGGGPAGMEAARIAALRGHKVTLYDANVRLGGQLLVGSVPPHKEQIGKFMDYLADQMSQLKVKVEQKALTEELVQKLKPDAVIVATGIALPVVPPIAGMDKISPVFAVDVITGVAQTGEKVAVIGGGEVGCETAELLADRGKKVTVIEMLPQALASSVPLRKAKLLGRLRQKGVVIMANTTCEDVSPEGLNVRGKDGQRQAVPADTIVIATGSKPDKSLYDALQGKVTGLYLVGDAVAPRSILEAVEEGFKAGVLV
jgi:2,4-dienoyl-CoA reductase-like NADH-dependent reductase (Old Yellow Enzyme family)/thioredoxin reductase